MSTALKPRKLERSNEYRLPPGEYRVRLPELVQPIEITAEPETREAVAITEGAATTRAYSQDMVAGSKRVDPAGNEPLTLERLQTIRGPWLQDDRRPRL